ncbi:MAG: response regulator [bacterium]
MHSLTGNAIKRMYEGFIEEGTRSNNGEGLKIPTSWSDYTILIIEKSEATKMILEQSGYNSIFVTNNEREALSIYGSEPSINLLLIDISIRNLNGVELVRVIRQMERDKWGINEIPIFALVTDSQEEYRKTFIDSGCNDYLLKPINIRALLKKLKNFYLS